VPIVQLVLVAALLGSVTPVLEAQARWGLAVELGMASFRGHAEAPDDVPETSAHPSPARTWGVRLDRTGRRVGLSVRMLIAVTGVEFENDNASAEAKNLLDLLEISPQVSYLIFQPREAAVRLHAGAVINRWSPDGDDARTSTGALGGVSIEAPFSTRVGVLVRWEGVVTGSVFDDDDLPPGFNSKSGWSQRYVLGVRYGF
jgi:hypothetical protein